MTRNNLEVVLKHINKETVRLQKSTVSANIPKLQKVLDAVETEFRNDPLFETLFKERRNGGSYFEKLISKVTAPDEYDVNFVLTMPEVATRVISTLEAGNVKIRVNMEEINRQEDLRKYRGLAKLLDDADVGYLSAVKTNSWFQALIDRALANLRIKFDVMDCSNSGSRRTLIVGNSFSINLVPAFYMLKNCWPDNYIQSASDKEFLVIPKSIDGGTSYWRCSFYEHEHLILQVLETAEETIRLLEVLREKRFPNTIKSYFVKTIFLLEISKYETSYKTMSVSDMFLKMLEKLEVYVRSGNIPFYWNEKLNLLGQSPNTSWLDVANSLQDVRVQITADPSKAFFYFCVDPVEEPSRDLSGTTTSGNDNEEATVIQRFGTPRGQRYNASASWGSRFVQRYILGGNIGAVIGLTLMVIFRIFGRN